MGIFSKFENRMEDTFEGAADKMSRAPISPVQIAKKAEKQMRREKMVGAGKQYAPTLYTVLVNPDDDERLFGYYPTLAGETETYLNAKAAEDGLVMDGNPLVRFVVDDSLKHGKFEVIAEVVAAPIVSQLRAEEMERYGLLTSAGVVGARSSQPQKQDDWDSEDYYDEEPQPARKPPLPYVPEEEIDRSIDYGEYTFNSEDFEDYRERAESAGESVPDFAFDTPIQQTYNSQDLFDEFAPASWRDSSYDEQLYAPGTFDEEAPLPYAPAQYERPIAQEAYAEPSYEAPSPRANMRNSIPTIEPAQTRQPAAQPQPQPAAQPQQVQTAAPNTVVFARGAKDARAALRNSLPTTQAVSARLIDVAYMRAYDLAGTHITLGRDTGNDIVVQDINASRKHAEMRLTSQGYWVITDMASMNGTLVNGTAVASQVLKQGDKITIGKTVFEFQLR